MMKVEAGKCAGVLMPPSEVWDLQYHTCCQLEERMRRSKEDGDMLACWHHFLCVPSWACSWILSWDVGGFWAALLQSHTWAGTGNSPPLQKCPNWWDRLKLHFPFSLMISWPPLASAGPSNSMMSVFPNAHYSSCSFLVHPPPARRPTCPSLVALQILSVLTMTAPDMLIPACLSAGPLSWHNQNPNAYFQNVGSCWKSRWGEQQHPGHEHWDAERGEGRECSWKVWDNMNSFHISYGFLAPCKKTVFTWI